ncbi:carboxypeptidase regulatory-like domain-containing protein [Cryptosporangium japonicum]|uniref:DUF11 domain-containing protein n=1 Tax=Cryptosporangium japonicum TaxID=80872 RepID=A0ABP3DQW0_9ACTN
MFLPAAPASAGDPADLRLEVRQGNLASQSGGQPASLVFAVTNDGPSTADAFNANVVIPFGDRGVYLASSSPSCNQTGGPTVLSCPVDSLEVGQTTVFTLVIGAPPVGSLQQTEAISAPGSITIDAGGDDPNNANDSSQFTLNLTGAPPAVTNITGSVADGSTTQPIVGASVVARDVNGATCVSTTDSAGAFNCTPAQPLAGGQVTIEATMAGYQVSRTTVQPQNGTISGVQLALNPTVASASPTPSVAPSSAAPVPSAAPQAIKKDDGFPWDTVVLVLGIVLALGGLGALGWWVYKRNDKDPDGPGGGTSDLPDLVAAESIMPTMPMRVPNALSETTVANELPGNEPTAAWGAPPADGTWVNRSTEPIPVSGVPGGWSGADAGRSSAGAERTAEWPTIDPTSDAPVSADPVSGTPASALPAPGMPVSGMPASGVPISGSSGRVAPSDPTTAWPTMNDGGWAGAPYTRAAGPLGDQYASALPAEAPGTPSGPPAVGTGSDQSWGTPGRPAYGASEYGANEYGSPGYGAPGSPDFGVAGYPNAEPSRSPLAGWDTPPAPMSAPPMPMSAPPMPMSGAAMSGQPMSGPPMPMSGPPHPAYPMPSHPGAASMGAGQLGAGQLGPGQMAPGQMGPGQIGPGQTGQWPGQAFPASAPPAPGYPNSAPPNYPTYPASAPPAPNYPMSGPPMPGQPMSGPPMPGQPMSGPPMPGQPMSGPPMPGQPMSGPPMPMSGPPMPMSGPPAPGQPMSAPPAGYNGAAPYGSYPPPPSYGPPANYGPPPNYGAPANATPPGTYPTPPGTYGAPEGTYAAPQGTYGAAPGAYTTPPATHGAPQNTYGPPPQWQQPQPGYPANPPQPQYDQPYGNYPPPPSDPPQHQNDQPYYPPQR